MFRPDQGHDQPRLIDVNEQPKIRVFFNSACPVCNAGISAQKKKKSVCPVEWQDVHLDNELVEDLDAPLEFVRERLHVVDENGKLQVGYDAFITIWRNSPGEKWKASLSSLPLIKPLLNAAYNVFARALYRWNRSRNHW